MKCAICLDDPPNDASIQLCGFATCLDCFAAIAPNLSENALQEMTIIYEG